MAKKKANQQPKNTQLNEFEQLIEDVVSRKECDTVAIIKAIRLMTDEIQVLQEVCAKIPDVAHDADQIHHHVEKLREEMSVIEDALNTIAGGEVVKPLKPRTRKNPPSTTV